MTQNSDMIFYNTLISTTIDIINDSYLNEINGLSKQEYIQWLQKVSEASRACRAACEGKLQIIKDNELQ